MFVTTKKFKRKNGIKRLYYVMENVKVGNKHKMRNVKYLGDVHNILKKFELAAEYEKMKENI
ncbi:MAG: hypothetical protein CVT90_01880 [Candidatus Altiarchaeales archaeon HGW-Altiarchaeales-3]|nr:MAG: hypothetical protein CVT90_01880 [Candidatus Altiarchaeales archaeon HGW-Altiarchaeales-3]